MTPSVVPSLLAEYGAITRDSLRTYLDVHGTRGAEYLRGALQDYPARGGRSLRATLCIAAARAFGATVESAVNSAVAVEILHNAFLVHDDIEDASDQRRGRPTMHHLHGVPVAINIGDALSVVGLRPLLENRHVLGLRISLRVLEEVERMARETIEGQAIELGWRRSNATDLGEEDYLRMVLKKTCWYTTIFPSRVGALIATRDGIDLDGFVPFGFFLGAAFQIQDDVLNLVGERKQYGKEMEGDLWEGKRTLMIIHLLGQTDEGERKVIGRVLRKRRKDKRDSEIRWLRGLIDHHRSLEYAEQVAHGLAGAACREFDRAFAGLPETRDLAFLRELPTWVLGRT